MIVLLLAATLADPVAAPGPVDFDTEVVPVLTRAGCNAGACHGSAAGRGGFKLSLLGSDPTVDHAAIAREYEGRRVDLARPGESLVLRKPGGAIDHEGGIRLRRGSAGAGLLETWIRQGARRLRLRRLTAFEVTPSRHVAAAAGERVTLRAVAAFDDGSRRDVTRWTVFTPDDPAALEITDPDRGEATVRRRGESVAVARFLSEVVPVRITVPIGEREVSIPGSARRNVVDDHINALLRTLRLEPAPPADDATFLRRARLAITGTLPQPEEVRAFLASDDPAKRGRLVDRLLDSEEFVVYWTWRLATLLRVRSLPNDATVARVYQQWIREQLERRTPYDVMARELLTAIGDSHERGEAAFYRMTSDAREHAEFVSELFLGARLRCANCHDHPLDRWTQDDYHGLAAVFARIERGRVVRLRDFGEVTHPATGEPASPRLPGVRFLPAEGDVRDELAAWLASGDNPRFARALANRLWRALMGRGLVEPVEDLRETNPATHPELLDALARDLVDHGFDLRRTLRLIAGSAAFERAWRPAGEDGFEDDRYHSRALVRPLAAEVLADAIDEVTGVPEPYGDEPRGTRAVALADPAVPSVGLDLLGRCSRDGACASPEESRGLATSLHLLNGELINRKVSAPEGRLARMMDAGKDDGEIVEELYLRAISRPPRREERDFWRDELAKARDGERGRREVLEDFLWSLLTCREFSTNH